MYMEDDAKDSRIQFICDGGWTNIAESGENAHCLTHELCLQIVDTLDWNRQIVSLRK